MASWMHENWTAEETASLLGPDEDENSLKEIGLSLPIYFMVKSRPMEISFLLHENDEARFRKSMRFLELEELKDVQ